MRLNDVRQWYHLTWTQLYEAALFERDKVKLCACLWNAQLAIIRRAQEIENLPSTDQQEMVALKKALGILRDLGQLSGLSDPRESQLAIASTNTSGTMPLDTRRRRSRRNNQGLAA